MIMQKLIDLIKVNTIDNTKMTIPCIILKYNVYSTPVRNYVIITWVEVRLAFLMHLPVKRNFWVESKIILVLVKYDSLMNKLAISCIFTSILHHA